jgi:hypothetical protein
VGFTFNVPKYPDVNDIHVGDISVELKRFAKIINHVSLDTLTQKRLVSDQNIYDLMSHKVE